MKKNVVRAENEIGKLQQRVIELEQQLAEAQAGIRELSALREDAQQKAEELNAIIQTLHDPVMVYDQNGVIYLANASAKRAHGFDPTRHHRGETNETLVIRDANGEVAHSDDLPSARALQGKTVVDEQLTITNANGQKLNILVTSTPLIVNGTQKGAVSVWRDLTQEKEAQEAKETALAQAAEEYLLLEALLKFIPEGICITGGPPDFPIKRVSQYGLKMSGNLDPSRVIGLPAGEHLRPLGIFPADGVTDLAPEETPLYRASHFGEITLNQEMLVRTPDGAQIPVLMAAAPIRNAEGKIIAAVNSWRDYTKIKQLEGDLRAAHDQAMWLARLPGENPNPVARVSDAGMVLYHNPPAGNLPGWRCQINEYLPLPLRRLVQQAFVDGQIVEQDVDLGPRMYAITVVPLSGEGYANVYGRDITEHKKAEEALKASERRQREITRLLEADQARLAAILRNLPVGVWIMDQNGRLIGSNEEADRIWRGELPILNSTAEYDKYAAWHPESGERLTSEEYPAAVALRTGEPAGPVELSIRRFDGREGTLLVSAAPIRDLQGRLTGVVGVNVDVTERKRSGQALEVSQNRINDILKSLGGGLLALDYSWSIVYVNEQAAEIAGLPANELIGKRLWDLWPELLGTQVEQAYRHTMAARVVEQLQARGTKSGRWYEVSVYPSSEGITIFYTDKTEQILAEERFNQAFHASPNALVISRQEDGRMEAVNHAFRRFFGYSEEEVIGKTSIELGMFANPADRQEAVQRLQRNKAIHDFELDVRLKSGEIRNVSLSIEMMRVGDKSTMLTTIQDVTERKKAEQALRESKERFHSLADSMPQLVWTALPDGTVDYYNQRYQEYRDIQQLEGAAWEWSPVLHPEDLQPTVEAWKRSVATGEIYQIEHRVRMLDGSYRWHLSRGIPVIREAGQVVRWFGTATDIHDLKLAQEELRDYAERLERSNQELEQFAFMASHDLQEPLRKIEMFGDLLMERAAKLDERERSYLERMRNAAARMRAMVAGLLQLSRVSTQGKPFISVDLTRVIAEVLADLETQLRRTGGKVDVGPLPAMEGDPLQLHQLLQNLIGNALKFHRPDVPPQVKVYSNQLPGKIQIVVEDNGIGFEEENAERIFQPFQRLTGRMEYEGSGIGLAICRRIVERHAGNISAVARPGHGTMFIVTLPVHHPEDAKGELRKDADE